MLFFGNSVSYQSYESSSGTEDSKVLKQNILMLFLQKNESSAFFFFFNFIFIDIPRDKTHVWEPFLRWILWTLQTFGRTGSRISQKRMEVVLLHCHLLKAISIHWLKMLSPHFTDRLLMYKETDLFVVCSCEVSQPHLGTQISVWVCIWAVRREKQGSWEEKKKLGYIHI